MKKNLCYIAALLVAIILFAACSKKSSNTTSTPSYKSTQGVMTANGGATFNASDSFTSFSKVVDTVIINGMINRYTTSYKQLLFAFEKPQVGNHNFDDVFDNQNSTTLKSYVTYLYEDTNAAGTIIAHQFVVKSGTYNIKSYSSTGIDGTYTATLNDVTANGEAPITLSGSFTGNF